MISARRYSPTNFRLFTWLFRATYGRWLCARYGAQGQGLELFDTLKPPFIVVGNHATNLDPFLANTFIPHPIHWVASDGNLRTPLLRFLLIKLVGSIPKSKAIPDIETVSWIVEFVRRRKGVVGFYPEGQATWNGQTLPALSGTAKLLKLLKVPVVCALGKGTYLSKPRWAYSLHRGQVVIQFSQLFAPQELKTMSVSEIRDRLDAAMRHDDTAWAGMLGLRFEGERRAECLELGLYACPSCGGLRTLKSSGETLRCEACGFAAAYGADGGFALLEKGAGFAAAPRAAASDPWAGALPDAAERPACPAADFSGRGPLFSSIVPWNLWQREYLDGLIRGPFAAEPDRPIFADVGTTLLLGKRMDKMKPLGHGRLTLGSRALRFEPEKGESMAFDLAQIDGPGVLKWNFLEFYVGMNVYRARFDDRAVSAYKYASALELLAAARKEREAAAAEAPPDKEILA
ncbi:1-acyl-sn-glycerol-3-phosphate acyltransferase [bacterium]|nr:1-acyl-sn-glycerol-3-phosphate acyltransferase [bacterium]